MSVSHKLALIALALLGSACTEPTAYRSDGRAFFIDADDESRVLRVSWYGDSIVRLQTAHHGEPFLPDDHYEIVQTHDWPHDANITVADREITISSSEIDVVVQRDTLAVAFYRRNDATALLKEQRGSHRQGNVRVVNFNPVEGERFTGLGHGYFARADRIELTGDIVQRNYGSKPIEQAPLIVPFFLSNRGYGVFLNSMFPNRFAMNADDDYSMAIDTHGFDGQMDYFFVAGPKLTDVLDRYTKLTGRPRLPPKSMFGLQLSDKGHDHNSTTPSDEAWWKQKVAAHRDAGLPLDHIINDNRWRAGGGKRCESRIEWDRDRFPDPAAWKRWLDEQGLVTTIDFNRCIARFSAGWDPSFNLPEIDNIEFADSAPDLTSPEFRDWFWQVFYTKSLDPALQYPGDALWIDEFDEQGAAPKDIVLANGRSSAEMRNYWFFLIAKALVADGWDRSDIANRPFVWVRGMTAGAQRYATLWSGDIKPNDGEMASQIRGMQLAGLAGFPYWGHDAGGFFDWDESVGPDESLYQRWAMAFGSFSPIWKPHGMGQSRWPLDRSADSQAAAMRFGRLRYELMPYIYSTAHAAAETGIPMTRPMLLEYPELDIAWQKDLQYLFGASLLAAPQIGDAETTIWLPAGGWYSLWSRRFFEGNETLDHDEEDGLIPVFARAGAVIPTRPYAQSTAFGDKSILNVDVYTGADGEFKLVEDDDRSEAYRDGERRITWLRYNDADGSLSIEPARGNYPDAPTHRNVTVTFITPGGSQTTPTQRMTVDDTLLIMNPR